METLLLTTTLVLSSQAPIGSVNANAEIQEFVNSEVNKVNTVVLSRAEVEAKDNFLFQAKHALAVAKQDKGSTYTLALVAE